MSITASIKIKGYVQNAGYGRVEIDTLPLVSAVSVPSLLEVVLASGNNTINVPVGSIGVIITLDPASVRDKTLKGIVGDTGIPISSTGVGGTFVLALESVTSFVIVSVGGPDTGIITRFQFF